MKVCAYTRGQGKTGSVRAIRVVRPTPAFDLELRVLQREEVVLVETFVSEPPVEALDLGVLHRLTGLNEMQLDAAIGTRGGTRFARVHRAILYDPLQLKL